MPRRQRITRDVVLEAAMRLVDEEGLDALTMRRLGDLLGTDPAMVYRLFQGKDDLLEALADEVFASAARDAPSPNSASTGSPQDDWQAVVRELAHGVRAALLAHPALIGVAVKRPPRGEATFRGIDAGLGVLLSAGLSEDDAAYGYQAVLFYALGFAVLEAPFAAEPDGGAAQQAQTHRALAELPTERYPSIAATIEHLYGPDLNHQFEYGLRLLIAGLASRVSAPKGAPMTGGGDQQP
jgi:TetR/AcrR family tetracycline transcriptional repressor